MSGGRRRLFAENRDFCLFWTGQALTALGARITDIALALLVLALTGSATWAGAFATVRLLALNLLRLPAGALADRWARRTTLVAVDAAKACCWGTLAVLVALDAAGMAAWSSSAPSTGWSARSTTPRSVRPCACSSTGTS